MDRYIGKLNVSKISLYQTTKILDKTKSKVFTDDKLNVVKMIIFLFDRVENIVNKMKMLVTSIFSFSHNTFKGHLPQGH